MAIQTIEERYGYLKNSFYLYASDAARLNSNTASAQLKLIDHITRPSPILANIPFERSTHDYWNMYRKLVEVQGPGIVDLNAPMPEMSAAHSADYVPLSKIAGMMKIGEDDAIRMGSKEAVVNKDIPAIARKAGNDAERDIYYNHLIRKAIEFGKAVSVSAQPADYDPTDPTKFIYSSIVAVTWSDTMTGLMSPLPYDQGIARGQVFTLKWLNNGALFIDPVKLNNIYACYMSSLIGMQVEDSERISALVNIGQTPETMPTKQQLLQLVASVSDDDNTRIYASRQAMLNISSMYSKSSDTDMLITTDGNGNLRILGHPVVTTPNVKYGKEPYFPVA